MGRFSCFFGHIHSQKQKKLAQPSFENMIKMLQLGSQEHTSANSVSFRTLDQLPMGENGADNLDSGIDHVSLLSRGWRSGELETENHAENERDSVGNLKRSLSVVCELEQKGRTFDDNSTDYCVDQDFSCDGSRDCNETAELSAPNDTKSPESTLPDRDHEAVLSASPRLNSDVVNCDSICSGTAQHFLEKEDHVDADFTKCGPNSGVQATPTPSVISKSYSMPNFRPTSPSSPGLSPRESLAPQNKSFEDLSVLAVKKDDVHTHDGNYLEIGGVNKDDGFFKYEKFEGENSTMENNDSYNYACSSKDWIIPVPDEMGIVKHDHGESSSDCWDHFPNRDFKTKLIEDWVLNLEHCGPVEETNDLTDSENEVRRSPAFVEGLDASKVGTKINPGMEAAKRYISCLGATSSTAHLSNYSLVAIPLLSAFVSLKVLNLSGNSIVRITAGALPRGLHVLNLSKNKISTIEGLRELTRLRALDLSYNKIARIGHGLASCSSLKELYLAGNKISEVEGLHRLLKLAVLDLRFNKIATSKCLGQLAANYNSLQAISLEGNPAQKNVGDEQLKKYLQGLLPHLAYYNRQHIKTSSLKDSSDRSVRLGISGHQFDRGSRSDHKSSRRVAALKRASTSSAHGHKGPAADSPKHSRGRQGLVPPSGSKTSHQRHQFDISNKIQSLKTGLSSSMHKSRSEGTLLGL